MSLLTNVNGQYLKIISILFSLLCKLEGLFTLKDFGDNEKENFFVFRKTIFECLNLVNDLVEICH